MVNTLCKRTLCTHILCISYLATLLCLKSGNHACIKQTQNIMPIHSSFCTLYFGGKICKNAEKDEFNQRPACTAPVDDRNAQQWKFNGNELNSFKMLLLRTFLKPSFSLSRIQISLSYSQQCFFVGFFE